MSELNRENDDYELGLPVNKSGKLEKPVDGITPHKKVNKKEFDKMVVEALNHKILKITLIIKAKFPELSKLLDEIPVAAHSDKDAEISIRDLSDYYRSLEAVLNKYKLEHPKE